MLEALAESGQTPDFFLRRHATGDWGEVNAEDKLLNDECFEMVPLSCPPTRL